MHPYLFSGKSFRKEKVLPPEAIPIGSQSAAKADHSNISGANGDDALAIHASVF